MIITGAAASGKSTVCSYLAAYDHGPLALDVDVFASGAAATVEPPDYVALWEYLLTISREFHQNGRDVLWCGICRPDQIAAQRVSDLESFSSIDMLILSCDREVHLDRLSRRPGGQRAAGRAEMHADLNDDLRSQRSAGRIGLSHLDTTRMTVQQTIEGAAEWARKTLAVRPSTQA